MKVAAIIQARMGSSRLPGKILKKVLGKPLLAFQLERVEQSKQIDELLVATTNKAIDADVANLCESLGFSYFRGSEADVLERYYKAAIQVKADVVVRLTGDCPIIDPQVIDKIIGDYLLRFHEYQYVSNTLNRTFPRGMDAEVFSFQALKRAHSHAVSSIDREHVTRYLVNNPEMFNLFNVSHSEDYSQHRWTVDTHEDFILISKIIEALYPSTPQFTMKDVIHLLEKNSDWRLINTHIQQKKD
ncbi:glycosyltransferase family protein [Virgibacillus sp. C22-A2]|uniref:Glycosyltransferase family protein n=1 Tax=Virgibacillus tibetensis TaxID=3042313 RepID=A0ABU6KFZ7_9BACI|nr:glycosyltransferase family protein [Virgibacillus sp. C22-A2]